MGKLETIKQKINQLDAGSFQNLCDSYLSKIGYRNIVSLGSEAGTRKTTPGTPDTYFLEKNDKYIFVEYTTQKKGLFNKIKSDIDKCLDISKIKIPHNKISEIIYCHTSSNLTPSQDDKLKDLCKEYNIKLTIIGIDKLSIDIYLKYPILARDFLNISISTGQILSFDDFINYYNSNKMAAPIDTKFLFREKELKEINEAFQKTDIVILNGTAGSGKTRLALHYVEKYISNCYENILCIHDKALPIYEDLKLYIDSPGNYFLFVDDANQLSGLKYIIDYVNRKYEGYNIKILITVRDYALKKVKKDIQDFTSYEIVGINLFSDDELKKLVETSLNIINTEYKERIISIAEGNARIAILAGRIACDSNCLDSIDDVSQLYKVYYTFTLEDNQMLANKNLCITAGVISFLQAIHLDYIDKILPILREKGIDREIFIENIYILHELEIVDICNDKAVRVSEQCLSNYLLYYVFYDKKLLSLSKMIKTCFQTYRERTISSVNTLVNIFKNETLLKFVEKEIKLLWEDLSKEKSEVFFEFLKVFFGINPTETLIFLQNKIESEEKVIYSLNEIDTEIDKNNKNVQNDIIKILGGFADMTDFETACDLFFQYYLKRPDLYMEFYNAVNFYFVINKYSSNNNYSTQITFFEKIIEYSNDWKQELIVLLFFEVARDFLKFDFTSIEEGRNHRLNLYKISINTTDGIKKYRELIWESLISLCKIDNYKEKVKEILNSYAVGFFKDINSSVLKFDLIFIKIIMKKFFLPDELENCIIAERIVKKIQVVDDNFSKTFEDYFDNENFQLYKLLYGKEDITKFEYEELIKKRRQVIREYVSKWDFKKLKKLIDVCNEVKKIDTNKLWNIGICLGIVFDEISQNKDLYVSTIKYYIKNDTPSNLNPIHIIDILFSLMSDSEVFQIINTDSYKQKNDWLYAYYHELPKDSISKNHLKGLYNFLKDTSDSDIILNTIREVDFLNKYNSIDSQVFIKGCKIILDKIEESLNFGKIYFIMLFKTNSHTPKEVISKFKNNLELLEKIYCVMLSCDEYHDNNGQFLREIYLISPSILDKYIEFMVEKSNDFFIPNKERNYCFFDLENFVEIYNIIFEQLIIKCKFPIRIVPDFLENLFLLKSNEQDLFEKQDKWIMQCIQLFHNDELKMYCLFSAISRLEEERMKKYFLLFLKYNNKFEDFKKLPLSPTSYINTGSAIPMYYKWIEFHESLLPELVGLKWLKHRQYVEEEIKNLKILIESEEISEILEG